MSERQPTPPNAEHQLTTVPEHKPAHLSRVMDVKVEVSVELGRRQMSISDVLDLAPNAVLEFFKKADEPLDIRVNGRLVARGEAVVMGERYGVRVTEVLDVEQHRGRVEIEDEES